MLPRVLSTNLAHAQRDPGGADRVSGIDKRPVPSIEVFVPGPSYGDGPGVCDDVVGDSEHHGGAQKAVYAFSQEELEYWSREIGRELTPGCFGENLTTVDLDLEALLVNQQVRIGEALLEVSVPRRPCRTFGAWMGVPQWVRKFTDHGRCGAYFRVVTPGTISVGDPIELVGSPGHDIDGLTAFRAAMGEMDAVRRVHDAHVWPAMYHDRLVQRLAKQR